MEPTLDLTFALSFDGAATALVTAAEAALFEEGEAIMATSRESFVPVDEGILKGSGHVEPPERHGDEIAVTLAYGGPAEAYAIVQHENKLFRHRVGRSEYLAEPVRLASGTLAHDLAERIRAKVGA
jgi:hypothetical protein